jgi:hypothetical protein
VLSRPSRLLDRRPPLLSGSPSTLLLHPISRASASRGINGGSSNSPVRSSPRLWPPGWNGPPLDFPPSFAPRRPGADDARRGGDRPTSTDLELRAQHHIGRSSNRWFTHNMRPRVARRAAGARTGSAACRRMRVRPGTRLSTRSRLPLVLCERLAGPSSDAGSSCQTRAPGRLAGLDAGRAAGLTRRRRRPRRRTSARPPWCGRSRPGPPGAPARRRSRADPTRGRSPPSRRV